MNTPDDSLKTKSFKGILWSFGERASSKVINFVITVIMARILLPDDYGIIAIINVFIAISQVFIDGGFATALIQDKKKTEADYSTIFTFNIIVAIVCYSILFFTAPLISDFYEKDLTLYIRVFGLTLIIYSFSAIHKVKLTVNINFKALAENTIITSIISGIIGVVMAYSNMGVWALIGQSLSAAIISTLLLNFQLKWKPSCFFNVQSFKRLFSFGAKLLAANVIDRIYMNLYPIFVGKLYTSTDLGYYSQAERISFLPVETLTDIFSRVTFPVMSTVDGTEPLVRVYRKYISLSSYVIFPLLLLVILLAKPIVLILLTEKWAAIIPLLQILCFGFILEHLSAINRNLLYVKGRSDLALKLEIVKKSTAVVILLVSVPFGLIGLCVGKAVYGWLAFGFNSYYTKRLIGISIWDQMRDFMPILLLGIICCVISYIPVHFIENNWIYLITGSLLFCGLYLALSKLFKFEAFDECLQLVRKNIF